MFGSDEDGDFTESSIFDLDSAPPPPDGHYSPRSRRWKQPGGSLTNALPVRKRALSAPSVRSSNMPSSRQVAFAATRDSENTLGIYGSENESSSNYPLETDGEDKDKNIMFIRDDDDDEDDDDEQMNYTIRDEEQHESSNSDDVDVTPNSRTSAEFIDDELDVAIGDEASPAHRVSSHDVSSSRWSDSEFHSNGESGEDTPSSTRSLPWGNDLPDCCSADFISWNRVAVAVVNKAPCFACIPMAQNTYRSVLIRLTILCAIYAVAQLISTLWFYIILESKSLVDRNIPTATTIETEKFQSDFEVLTNVWNINGSIWFLGVLAVVVLVAIALTTRVIQNVNLAGAVRLFWVLLWVIPLQVVFLIGLFDSFGVTKVWITFWWRDRTMAWFRRRFCDPPETANTLCAVPEFRDERNETSWCLSYYNSTDCVAIRDSAQDNMFRFITLYYYVNAAMAICFGALLHLMAKTLESIISKPLIQKSRESNVPAWLLLPIAGCASYGALYAFSTTSGLSTRSQGRSEASWIGPLFMTAGGLFFMEATIAGCLRSFSILNTTDKRRKSIAIMIFILIAVSLLVMITTIFSASIAFSLSLQEIPISDTLRGEIACFIDQSGSCTHCADDDGRCPEWGKEDVTKILQTQAKTGAAFAAVFIVYAIGMLRYGLTLRRHISNYQIAYV